MIYLNSKLVPLATSAAPTGWLSSSDPGALLIGTAGTDRIAGSGNATMVGGAADDSYYAFSSTVTITEQYGNGIDTIVASTATMTLPANVENLQMLWQNSAGLGNALDNLMIGSAGSQTLDGGAGDDVLVGDAGADTFAVSKGNGSDVIVDFEAGIDRVHLSGCTFQDFAAVKAAMTQTGADVVLALGNGEGLVFRNTLVSAFGSGDFWLTPDASRAGMTLTFSEEFDSLSASAWGIGTTWKTTYGINKTDRTLTNNKEAEYYSDSSVGVNPFATRDGVLDITAAPGSNPLNLAYTSGLLTTAKSFSQQYGYFEIRADLPAGKGFWPAFWMLPADGSWPSEIDIFEVLGNDPTTAYYSLHTTTGWTLTNAATHLPDLSAGFHTYGLSWLADTITWYLDGAMMARRRPRPTCTSRCTCC